MKKKHPQTPPVHQFPPAEGTYEYFEYRRRNIRSFHDDWGGGDGRTRSTAIILPITGSKMVGMEHAIFRIIFQCRIKRQILHEHDGRVYDELIAPSPDPRKPDYSLWFDITDYWKGLSKSIRADD